MNFKAILFASAAVAVSAGAAMATPLDEAKVSLGYESVEADGADLTGLFLRGDTTLAVGGVETDLSAAYGDMGDDNAALGFSIAPKFDLGNGIKVGGFFDYTYVDEADTDTTHYGVEADFVTGDLTFSGFFGMGDLDGEDSTVYGLSGNFDLAGPLDAGAFYSAETIDDLDVDLTEMGVSIGYDLSALSIPLYASASLSQIEIDDETADKLAVTFTLPLGNSGKADKGIVKTHDHSIAAANSFLAVDD